MMMKKKRLRTFGGGWTVAERKLGSPPPRRPDQSARARVDRRRRLLFIPDHAPDSTHAQRVAVMPSDENSMVRRRDEQEDPSGRKCTIV